MLDYTAIDFETANSYRGSPCSVGLVKVRDGQVVDTRQWLIRPPEAVDFFDGWNIAIHGITPEMVSTAPRWREILPHIVDFIGSDVLVTHNAGFDIGVIRYACAVDNIEWPALRFLCTLVLSRRALRLPTYRLPYVAESLGFVVDDHHDALADAEAVVEIVSRLAAQLGASTLDDLAGSVHVGIGHMSAGIYRGSVAISSGGGSDLVQPDLNPDADRNGYLYGRVVVFTGTLMSMTRQIAWEECAGVGARAENNVTKRTNVLVVGDINPAVLRPGSEVTGKARKAFEGSWDIGWGRLAGERGAGVMGSRSPRIRGDQALCSSRGPRRCPTLRGVSAHPPSSRARAVMPCWVSRVFMSSVSSVARRG
ncbi:DNA polymerase III subunit epsilon [Luteimicrobium album]|uniref:DNA polymerase III subunit epsilon n=1 Tax=Luteimicrobium album TaxID=1054550 RepID=A0ABQ6I790_9MICO|nr:exonuclease domain-containing protein [Luteimicrobium album]GMA25620.1 DNA polymerase III subunit epsilon [Luteimicrobium album]